MSAFVSTISPDRADPAPPHRKAHNMTMNDTPQEESPVPWEELFGYMPEITDGLPVADYLEGIRGPLGCWLVRAIGGEQS